MKLKELKKSKRKDKEKAKVEGNKEKFPKDSF